LSLVHKLDSADNLKPKPDKPLKERGYLLAQKKKRAPALSSVNPSLSSGARHFLLMTATLLGRKEAVVVIHGSIGREERLKAQESFKHDPEVNVLIATDAAGEGINLQRAHLMVNYDLQWNPNRIEQRFGRIHRIGQTEVCRLWNLVLTCKNKRYYRSRPRRRSRSWNCLVASMWGQGRS
jgi:superfamily II DNA/RNA helicase